MNVRQMLSNTPRGITVEMKAAAIDRIGRILDDASQDPEKFIRIVRTQLGRDERALFTYGHVRHRAEKGDTGAMALLAEFAAPRVSGMSPARRIAQPRMGARSRATLASHFISQGRWEMRKGSALDSWLLTTTVRGERRSGMGPCTPKCQ